MKYNDNGEIKNIIIKAGDTLPIGTEVDYDGESIPAGWQEVEETIVSLGATNNADTTISISDGINSYKYFVLVGGYAANRNCMTIPTIFMKLQKTETKYNLIVPTYNGYGSVNLEYVNDTTLKLNGLVRDFIKGSTGTDTVTRLFGVK